MYNNAKIVSEIRRYLVEYIQNLFKMLADLKQVKVTVLEAESQYCQAGRKDLWYICDDDGRNPDMIKV